MILAKTSKIMFFSKGNHDFQEIEDAGTKKIQTKIVKSIEDTLAEITK